MPVEHFKSFDFGFFYQKEVFSYNKTEDSPNGNNNYWFIA